MKELSIEEKAKRYDKAIEKAEKWHNAPNVDKIPTFGNRIIEDIFPELKESEDERIKKQIISFLKEFECDHYRSLDFSSWIVWLEKQGKQKPVEDSLTLEEFENAFITKAEQYDIDLPNRSWDIYALCKELYSLKHKLKQGEQKPVDKVEPKFKVGDWIIDKQGFVHQIKNVIENVTNDTFGYDIVGGGYFNDNSDVRLWTIKDAKDGDVLHSPSHHLIWIYKNSVQYHACVNTNYAQYYDFDTNGWLGIPKDIFPATKDEQTILFERIKRAGYEWNEDKKELIKL